MKVKLLKKLRKKAEKYYQVSRYFDGYYVVRSYRTPACVYWDKTVIEKHSKHSMSLEEAVKSCDSCRREFILSCVRNYRNYPKYAKLVY